MKGKKTSVLIIEDEWEYSDSLRDILEERGFCISESTTGEEGIKKVKDFDYDVALIDIKLPDMQGTQILEKIRKVSPDTVPIMMTAYASVESAIEALEHGAFAYLYKPVNIEELLIYIDKAKEKKHMLYSSKIQNEILNNINLAVILTNSSGKIIFYNNKATELFETGNEELIGSDIRTFFASEAFETIIPENLKSENTGKKVSVKSNNGKKLESFLSISVIEGSGKSQESIIWTFIPAGFLSSGITNE